MAKDKQLQCNLLPIGKVSPITELNCIDCRCVLIYSFCTTHIRVIEKHYRTEYLFLETNRTDSAEVTIKYLTILLIRISCTHIDLNLLGTVAADSFLKHYVEPDKIFSRNEMFLLILQVNDSLYTLILKVIRLSVKYPLNLVFCTVENQ